MKKYIVTCFLLSFVTTYGFLPKLVNDQELTIGHPLRISEPEIAQAFHGELKGRPVFYKIISEVDFDFYINIMSPVISDTQNDFTVEVYGMNKSINLNGEIFDWQKYYDKFTGNNYWRGPSYEEGLSKGEYIIEVSNPDNLGKYVLLIGQQEFFPLKEAINTIFLMPKLKSYFGQSFIGSYFNQFGLFLFIFSLVLIILIIILILLFQHWSHPRYRPL